MTKRSNKKIKTTDIILNTSRILLALVFIFSGFVKAIDPLGLTYKIEDYFTAFGSSFDVVKPLAFYLSIFLSSFEMLLGLNLLFRVQQRLTAGLTLLFMLVMTPLTLYIALYNPVSDCGCFGDALKLTNWQTFFKNIVFLTLAVLVFVFSRKKHPFFLATVEWVLTICFLLFGIGISTYAYNHLPLIDFLPYKKGVNIPESMYVPNDAPADKYQTTFIYERNGVQKEFTLDNYPKDDTTWVFVDQKTILISEGYKAPIHDFHIVDTNYEDITDKVIYSKGYTWLLVMYDLNKTSNKGAAIAEHFFEKIKGNNAAFYALTASGETDIATFKKRTGVTYPFCNTDPTTLKTMIRANPGLILIKNGNIVGKWHWNDIE